MQLLDGRLVFTATDLAGFSRCEHLTTLDRGYVTSKVAPFAPPKRSPFAELLSRVGREHEADYVAKVIGQDAAYRAVHVESRTIASYEAAASETVNAMLEGVPRIYQAVFFDDQWIGIADFLMRVERSSSLGAWSYEVIDVKLARDVRPHFVLQLCSYSEQLSAIQHLEPEFMRVSLGTGETVAFRYDDFKAYYRRLKRRFLDVAKDGATTSPYPNEFCIICHWGLNCLRQWEHVDHLSQIANIRRQHVHRLTASGITTLTQLGEQMPAKSVSQLRADTLRTLHDQARLQLGQKRTGERRYEFLPLEKERGLQRLPIPSEGDMYLDVEADPFAGDGMTYLIGLGWHEHGSFRYEARWAHDPAAEKTAFEQVVDVLTDQHARYAAMHIYHYGAADVTTLKHLMGRYGTREEELDELLRAKAFVDLYSVVRHAIRISQPSYSLKKVEEFFFARGEHGVADAGSAILAYEEWLQTRNDELLSAIEAYNREDCMSVAQLCKWLVELRSEAEKQLGSEIAWWSYSEPEEQSADSLAARNEEEQLAEALFARSGGTPDGGSPEQNTYWLLSQLVRYHRREQKPAYWWHFRRREMSKEELLEDHECIAELTPSTKSGPVRDKKSTIYTLNYPGQQHKFESGDSPIDPATDKSAGEIVFLDDKISTLRLRRGPSLDDVPLPEALIPAKPINTMVIREALRRFAREVLSSELPKLRYRAAVDILLTRTPRVRGAAPGSELDRRHMTIEQLQTLLASIDESFLFIQGPPGAGKTWTAARLAVHLLKQKKRVGIAASTHKAIHNLLHEIEAVALPDGVPIRGLKKCGETDETEFQSKFGARSPIANSSVVNDFTDRSLTLIAGTAWLFANQQLNRSVDYLFIDEAGQVSLANAVAMASATENVVLLGDPLQLAQVSQGAHPGHSGDSVLEYVLGSDATIPPTRGVFLDRTWRMHPAVCQFVSEIIYENRLESAPGCERQQIVSKGASGAGVRFIETAHEGNTRFSVEEASRIRDEIRALLDGGTVSDSRGAKRGLVQGDIMVVTPYNAQVRAIGGTLRSSGLDSVEVGTVDKFQGREAPVVFYSLAASSSEDVPRDIEFLFSRNRLNVAVSRARCLSIVVASPKLLDATCRTAEQMRLVNGLCRFVEVARSQSS